MICRPIKQGGFMSVLDSSYFYFTKSRDTRKYNHSRREKIDNYIYWKITIIKGKIENYK